MKVLCLLQVYFMRGYSCHALNGSFYFGVSCDMKEWQFYQRSPGPILSIRKWLILVQYLYLSNEWGDIKNKIVAIKDVINWSFGYHLFIYQCHVVTLQSFIWSKPQGLDWRYYRLKISIGVITKEYTKSYPNNFIARSLTEFLFFKDSNLIILVRILIQINFYSPTVGLYVYFIGAVYIFYYLYIFHLFIIFTSTPK